ncbi:uncharacterized protein LOC143721667 [Siphateles boraxobius]|uniref:uncharacterized protein LOC143721667 n=1 Tax=Siphateles boraxobius TaxID=180520 RepID=UPI0040646A19
MEIGLADAEYSKVNKDLNTGVRGDPIFLWYYSGSTESDIPIVSLNVTKDAKEEPALLQDGWERLGCDLNRGAGGNYIYLWVKREKPSYICEVTASVDFYADKHLFELGFTRVDEDTNRGAGGNQIFIWYRRRIDMSKALTALDVSTCAREESNLRIKGFKRVNADLNKGTTGKSIYLWYIKGNCGSPIKAMVLLVNPQSWDEYTKANIVINKNLNDGNKGMDMYLAYK